MPNNYTWTISNVVQHLSSEWIFHFRNFRSIGIASIIERNE